MCNSETLIFCPHENFQAKKDHNYARFFSLLRSPSTPYLYACVMFKYVESTRKEALTIMSRTYGAKHKTTGEPHFDSYPLANLVHLLCYEDEDEARGACEHYGLTVKGDQVMWRHSKFSEPRDPVKGHIIPLKPRKMTRTIETKAAGATRLSVCRGGVSGEGSTLSGSGDDAAAVAAAAKARAERQKALEDAERKRKEEYEKKVLAEARAKELAERIEKEKRRKEEELAARRALEETQRRERLEAERRERERLAREEAARKEQERIERERRELEEQHRREEEARRAEAARLARLREEEALRQAEVRAARERAEKERLEREEKIRQAELRRFAEEERIRKAREEEERRIEQDWQEKIAAARKVLAWRLWRKRMGKFESKRKSRESLDKLDPTMTSYPLDLAYSRPNGDVAPGTHLIPVSDSMKSSRRHDKLERLIYQLASDPRPPIDLAEIVARCIKRSEYEVSSEVADLMSSPVVEPYGTTFFKLAVILPVGDHDDSLVETMRMWVDSRLDIGRVRTCEYDCRHGRRRAQIVTVIGDEDPSGFRDCHAALFLLPSIASQTTRPFQFSEDAVQLLTTGVPRLVLVLDDSDYAEENTATQESLQTLAVDGKGVAIPLMSEFEDTLQSCCQTLAETHTSSKPRQLTLHDDPRLIRVSLSSLVFLCLQRLVTNLDNKGYFGEIRSEELIFELCQDALLNMIASYERCANGARQIYSEWPPSEFRGMNELPLDWTLPVDLVGEVNSIFGAMLQAETFSNFIEPSIEDQLPPDSTRHILNLLDHGRLSQALACVVSLCATGDLKLRRREDETILYLPALAAAQVVRDAAEYEPPPEPAMAKIDIPDYLSFGDRVEKENDSGSSQLNASQRTTPPRIETKRRKTDDPVLKEERPKRARANTPESESEEERKSREFTSFLEAVLGG